jgi:hypothetical protein
MRNQDTKIRAFQMESSNGRRDAGGSVDSPPSQRGDSDHRAERGAALVEFALVLPLLILIVLGIVDFGYALSQQLDVRHGAREVSRMVATDDYDKPEACNRMDVSSGATITLRRASSQVGTPARVTVEIPLSTASGFFDSWLPNQLRSDVRVRIEQPPTTWSNLQIDSC